MFANPDARAVIFKANSPFVAFLALEQQIQTVATHTAGRHTEARLEVGYAIALRTMNPVSCEDHLFIHANSILSDSFAPAEAKTASSAPVLFAAKMRLPRIEPASLIFFWLLFEIFHRAVAEYPVRDPSCEGEQDTEPEGEMPEQRGKADNNKEGGLSGSRINALDRKSILTLSGKIRQDRR